MSGSVFSSVGNYLFGVPQPSSQPYTQQAQQLQQQAGQYAGREQSDYNNEAGLAAILNRTATGTAPSAADMQLTSDFGQNLKNMTAAGAGATGANAVLARYLATQGVGTNGAALAQAAGIQKAREAQAAQQQLSGLYGNMASQSGNLYGTNLSTGLGYNQLANNVNQANATRDQQSEAALLSGLSGAGAMYFGRSPGAGAGTGGEASGAPGGDAFAPGGLYGGGGLSASDSADFAALGG